jgi:hypothetical protein
VRDALLCRYVLRRDVTASEQAMRSCSAKLRLAEFEAAQNATFEELREHGRGVSHSDELSSRRGLRRKTVVPWDSEENGIRLDLSKFGNYICGLSDALTLVCPLQHNTEFVG